MKIDWKRKLSSRKFWAALIGFITPLLVMLGLPESEVTQVHLFRGLGGCVSAGNVCGSAGGSRGVPG